MTKRTLTKEANGPDRLYFIAPSETTQQGCGGPPPDEAVGGPVAFIDIGDHLEKKVRATQQHASQTPPFAGDVKEEANKLACHELFRLARPRKAVNGADSEMDLFAALT